MNSTEISTSNEAIPQFAVPDSAEAVACVNRWLHREVGTAVHAASATFDPATFYWHIPIELSYGGAGPLGPVGDVYLHAATGEFAGSPSIEEFRERAELLAAAHQIA
jgi:hypothetical protein